MGKLQFHRKVEEKINAQKEKVFKLQRGNNLKMFYETQAIQENEENQVIERSLIGKFKRIRA